MPWLFIRWLLCRFFWNIATTGLALTMLLTVFDLLANASEVSLGANHTLLSLLFYVLFRLPIIGNFILPFAVLVAAVQTFASLAAQREIIALESARFPLAKIVLVLAVGAGLLATLQFVAADWVVPDVTERLAEWKADGYAGLPSPEKSRNTPEWLASGNFIIRLDDVSLDGRMLSAPTVIETDARGVADRYWSARRAANDGHGWVFENVRGKDLVSGSPVDYDRMVLPIAMPPALFSMSSKPVEELRFLQLQALGWSQAGTQIHPPEIYRVWTHARWAQPLGGVLMVLLAAPICLQIQRSGRRHLVSAGVFALGFFYFILQSILLAVGEQGGVPPYLAAWGAFLVFGTIGLVAITFRLR